MTAGSIILWHGSLASVPTGWHLCDGTNGTPDLRDKFIVGAGGAYDVTDTGGAVNHTHLVGNPTQFVAGFQTTINEGVDTNEGSNLPPYYALAYIMKL